MQEVLRSVRTIVLRSGMGGGGGQYYSRIEYKKKGRAKTKQKQKTDQRRRTILAARVRGGGPRNAGGARNARQTSEVIFAFNGELCDNQVQRCGILLKGVSYIYTK